MEFINKNIELYNNGQIDRYNFVKILHHLIIFSFNLHYNFTTFNFI
jgi:hypothetical protein